MAVQVSGGGAEVDPEPLRGIKTFVRDILPCHNHVSPEGGTTPVLSDPGLEDPRQDKCLLKRKSCQAHDKSAAASDESDSEHLPSSKRQRITVSAMRRLFAKFSLGDTEDASRPVRPEGTCGDASRPSDRTSASRESPDRAATPDSGTEDGLSEDRARRSSSGSSRPSPVTTRSEKRISETESEAERGDKRQRTGDEDKEEQQETKDAGREEDPAETKKADGAVATTSEDASKSNKRQVDAQESDADDKEVSGNKAKRTRRLRRGLRLSTNITCYIEQVLYN